MYIYKYIYIYTYNIYKYIYMLKNIFVSHKYFSQIFLTNISVVLHNLLHCKNRKYL